MLKTRSKLTVLTHQYFTEQNYIHIDTPLISSNDCEGAGEAFIIKAANDDDFFGDNEKYLPVSGQLHLEAMTRLIFFFYLDFFHEYQLFQCFSEGIHFKCCIPC